MGIAGKEESCPCLTAGLLLLLLPEGKETNTRDLDDLETDTRDISLG